MKLTRLVSHAAGFALVATALVTMNAQTVVSNETLVTTTFVVIKDHPRVAKCAKQGCTAVTAMLDPISVACPGGSGQTCTIHISLDAKVSMAFPGHSFGGGGRGFYKFLVDNAAPTLGPTGINGVYLLEENVYTAGSPTYSSVQSVPASVLAAVTNSGSGDHTVTVNIGCHDTVNESGCTITSHQGTMRVDMFQP